MNLPSAIARAIAGCAALSLAPGCTSVWGCNPDTQSFALDEDLSVQDAVYMVEGWGEDGIDDIPCERACGQALRNQNGWEVTDTASCEVTFDEDAVAAYQADTASGDGSAVGGHVVCSGTSVEYFCEGRRPLGHRAFGPTTGPALGRSLAAMAALEAASVVAFDQLVGQLTRWGAPASLIDRARAAADDEVRHARTVAALACAHGGEVGPIDPPDPVAEDLLAAALHNAVEGCVHETWAAVVATVRARTAGAPSLRRAFAGIAEDETRHAQLAWDLHDWFCAQLPAVDAARVHAARAAALAGLPDLAAHQGALHPTALGTPAPSAARALATGFLDQLAA